MALRHHPVMKLLVFATAFLLARAADATGVCENTTVRYDPPELFNETTLSFAIPASQPWCTESMDGGAITETRGSVAFVELRDVHNRVLGILSTAEGVAAEHLKAAGVGAFEAVPAGKLHATLRQRGYAPLVSAPKSCKLTTAWTDIASDRTGGWRSAVLQLDLSRGPTRLLRSRLGDGSIARRGDQLVRASTVSKQSIIAVFAVVPSCSGPPPGYFSPDDAGDCYHVNTPMVMALDATSTPALAACF
jgi:hypothetical protein